MNTNKRAVARLKQTWSHVSKHLVWAAVIATLIAAVIMTATPQVVHLARQLVPEKPKPQQEAIEEATVSTGTWGPSRTIYRCNPGISCLGADHVVFDSTVNDPFIGDERYFMTAKVLGARTPLQSAVWVNPGDTVLIRAFIANNAEVSRATWSRLTAHGTRFQLTIPTNNAKVLPLIGKIVATNADPRKIHDTVFLRSHLRFSVKYDWGSALFTNRSHRALRLSDDIVGEGTPIGYRNADGIFPPCLCNGGYVTLAVHVDPSKANEQEGPINTNA